MEINMKKRIVIFITALTMMIFIVGFMFFNNEKKVELVQVPKSTMEPYEIYNEWNPKYFEEYGFKNLMLPAEVYHERIEKGESYVIGSFYTDNFDRFSYFFQQIYRVLWGEIYDVSKVLEVNGNIHSFKERCVIPELNQNANGVKKGNASEYMTVYIEFDDKENKVTIECRKEAKQKESKKEPSEATESTTKEKDKPKTKNNTEESIDNIDGTDSVDGGNVGDTGMPGAEEDVDIDTLLDMGEGSSEDNSGGY